MERLSAHEIVALFLALSVLLGAARLMGELARWFGQPAVLGEILAGVLLGPTALGHVSPELLALLFPREGHLPVVLDGLVTLGVVLFLLVAGMEVDLSAIWRQGRAAAMVGVSGIAFPFVLGFAAAWLLPGMLGRGPDTGALVFALFFATALSISALPVIARTLMDLNLYRSDLGMIVIVAAIFNDLLGWIIFAFVLGMLGSGDSGGWAVRHTLWMMVVFTGLVLTAGRWILNRALPLVQAHTVWPGGVLSFALVGALLCAALTEWIGVHAIFGALMFGVALGDSAHLREQTRATMEQFISVFFAPLFFASIGLKVDFLAHFSPGLVGLVLLIACLGKVAGCWVGARLGGIASRESLAIGFGMNARGAMEIILGLLALQAGIIREPMFVALVVMALATSVISGPAMQRLLHRRKPRRLAAFMTSRTFINPLQANDRWEAIAELSRAAAAARGLEPGTVIDAVSARERLMSTSLANGVAVPHARLDNAGQPLVAVGISPGGVDFDAADGEPARLILLILTAATDDGAQIELLGDIGRSFGDPKAVEQARACRNFTEFRAFCNSVSHSPSRHSRST